MKTLTGPRLLGGALFLLLSSPAGAQEDPITITVSGDMEMTFAARDGTLNEASFWTPGGLPPTSPLRDNDTFVLPRISLRLDAEGAGRRGAIEIGTTPLDFDSFDTRLQDARLGEAEAARIDLRQAWIEFFGGVRFGAQDFLWDPMGLGQPLFLNPSGAESPWTELPDSTVPPFPAFSTNTVPQTRRDTRHPVGLAAEAADLTLFSLLLQEGGTPAADEGLFGAACRGTVGDVRAAAILALFTGGSAFDGHRQAVWTGGLFAAYEHAPFLLAAEGYRQFGDAGHVDTDGDGRADTLQARGSAYRLIARYADAFRLQGAFVRVSGDKSASDKKEGRFLSYENNDATLIIEGNEFGLDIDSNYESAQVSGGFEFTLLEKRIQPRALLAFFSFLHAIPLPPDPPAGVGGRSRDLGTELDLGADLPWSPSLTFSANASFLFGADALKEFTLQPEDPVSLFTVGFRLQF